MKEPAVIAGVCSDCQEKIPEYPEGHVDRVGYVTLPNGGLLCYSCCAVRDREWMTEHGHIVLYLIKENRAVVNWPGTLHCRVDRSKEGKHNIAGSRIDVWFRGPEGNNWWGVNYGEHSQLVHCKRIKT